jgi:hypothetical protein
MRVLQLATKQSDQKLMNVCLLREVLNDWRIKNHQPYVS